jgi:polar amino acid transport system substrate-binding protein
LRKTLVVAAVVLLLPVAGARADMKEIAARGSLRIVAAEGEQPEMFAFDGGARPGLERECLEGFARLKKLKLEVVKVKAFNERIPALLRGEGDVVVGLVDTAERRKQIDFTSEVLPVRHVVVTAQPRKPPATLEDARRLTFGIIPGTTWARETAAAGVAESQTVSFPDTEPMLDALDAGRIDAAIMTISDFTLAAKRHRRLEAGVAVGESGRAAWGIRKADVELKRELDAYLDNLRSGPSWNRLVVVYFGEKALTALGRRTK